MPEQRKVCGSCSRWRKLSDFWADRARPDGKQNSCKDCRRAIQRRYDQYRRETGGYLVKALDGTEWAQPPLPL